MIFKQKLLSDSEVIYRLQVFPLKLKMIVTPPKKTVNETLNLYSGQMPTWAFIKISVNSKFKYNEVAIWDLVKWRKLKQF